VEAPPTINLLDALPPPPDIDPEDKSRSPTLSLVENLSVFLGLDGAKGPDDLGINANFGLRSHVNWGYPIWERYGLGVQLGTAINYSPSAVKVLEAINGTNERTQSFTTVGLFQRTDCGLKWGVVYDFLFEHYYQEIGLGQWRGQAGYEFRPADEAGAWFTIPDHGDHASVGKTDFGLEPIWQGNLYYRHTWSSQVDTRFWVGLAQRHSKFNLVLPGNTPVHDAFVFGADLQVPLNDWLALFGEANFITPNDTGTVTATLGVAVYPGTKAAGASHRRFAPLLPVANNPSFAVDVDR
jgi:hypothetical protein